MERVPPRPSGASTEAGCQSELWASADFGRGGRGAGLRLDQVSTGVPSGASLGTFDTEAVRVSKIGKFSEILYYRSPGYS